MFTPDIRVMKSAAMRSHIRDRMYVTSPETFEVLCKMVLNRRLDTDSFRVTAFRQDDGIDVEGVIDEDMLRFQFGAQAKRYDENSTVSIGYVQRFGGALDQGNYHTGTYITSSSFTKPAQRTAEKLQIHLVDGEQMARAMVDNRIGVKARAEGYEISEAFWEALAEPEEDDTVPSNEVPLADSFETLRTFLRAIDGTDGSKQAIHGAVPEFDSRHADLYGTAGWLLGFVHKETPKEIDGMKVRRWGLTHSGVKYLTLHERGQSEDARSLLVDAIRQVEIIERVYTELEETRELSYDDLQRKIAAETTLSESSVARRSSTISKWLTTLPEIEERPLGRSKKFVLV